MGKTKHRVMIEKQKMMKMDIFISTSVLLLLLISISGCCRDVADECCWVVGDEFVGC